jgi:spore germination protein YaaH
MLIAALALAAPPKDLPLSAWLVLWNPESIKSFERNASKVAEVKVEWIGMDAQGMPFRRPLATPENLKKVMAIARRHKVRAYAMISNFAVETSGFDFKRVQAVIPYFDKRINHIQALAKIVNEDGWDGLDVDIESLQASDRTNFSYYLEELGKELRRHKKAMTVTVHPKESEPGSWDGPQAQDWKRIGKAADGVKVMTYDFSWSTSDPGPIAPDDWAERVMTFAASQIPAAKLEMGVAQYGYNWDTKPAASLTWKDWSKNQKASEACTRSGERIFGKTYFSGADAFRRKQAIASKLGLKGLAMWYVGSEDPAIWRKP